MDITEYETWNTRFYENRSSKGKPQAREKLLSYGAESLSDLELMTAIIGSGSKDHPVEELAQKAMQVLLTKNHEQWRDSLTAIPGLGGTKAAIILAALEYGSRIASSREIKVRMASDLHPLLQPYALEKQEHFVVVALNGAHEILSIRVVSVGSVNRTVVHPRDVFSEALKQGASSLIVAHNHPSGTLEPSVEDYQLTERLILSAKALGVQLLDHLIVTKTGFFSFREETSIFTREVLSTGELTKDLTYTVARNSPILKNWLEEIQMKP